MAEIFGAVASGAGLLSLSMQLLETAQKLKGFYDASKDAPETIESLCFELETMSLSLYQIEQYRRKEIFGNELLERCMKMCERTVGTIANTVEKIEVLSGRSRLTGRITVAFKEPAIEKQLRDLERAKTTLIFVYMQFRDFYNERDAENRALVLQAQTALLSHHSDHLRSLERTVMAGNAAIIGSITTAIQPLQPEPHPIRGTTSAQRNFARTFHQGRESVRCVRIRLPAWFARNVWEFSLQRCGETWSLQLRPIIHRPLPRLIQLAVRRGNVPATRRLLWARHKGHDRSQEVISGKEADVYSTEGASRLLMDAAKGWHHDLCALLLNELTAHLDVRDLSRRLMNEIWVGIRRHGGRHLTLGQRRQAIQGLYKLFDFETNGTLRLALNQQTNIWFAWRIVGTDCVEQVKMLLDSALCSSSLHFSLQERFTLAMRSQYWSAETFLTMISIDSFPEVLTWADERGRTALHWAAEHFAASMTSFQHNWKKCPAVHVDYAKLIEVLLARGADPHAVSIKGHTPLVRMLSSFDLANFGSKGRDWIGDTTLENLSLLVRSWGDVVFKTGQDPEQYATTECALHREASQPVHICLKEVETSFLVENFTIQRNSRLSMTGVRLARVEVWDEIAPPGSWIDSARISRICWNPYQDDTAEHRSWRHSSSFSVRSSTVIVDHDRIENHLTRLQQGGSHARINIFYKTQDDNGPQAMAISSRERTRISANRKDHSKQRRTSSLPRHKPHHYPGLSNGIDFHMCPLDGRWKGISHVGPLMRWEICMRGKCRQHLTPFEPSYREYYRSSWLQELTAKHEITPEKSSIARRFVARFMPEALSKFDDRETWRNEEIALERSLEERALEELSADG